MDTNQAVVSQPGKLLPVAELFKKSFEAYWKKMWVLAGMMLFGCAGFVVLLPLAGIGLLISFQAFSHSDFNITLILIDILLGLIGLLISIIFGLWSRVALFLLVTEENSEFKKSLKNSWHKLGSFFWVTLLAGLATLGGLILFIIPGIIFAVWFTFSVYVFILEGSKGTAALKRSKQLVSGLWWPIFGRVVAVGIISILISWIKGVGPIINIFFTTPFIIVYTYMLYQDVKRVKG